VASKEQGVRGRPTEPLACVDPKEEEHLRKLHEMATLAAKGQARCTVCSSVGRLFDGVMAVAYGNIVAYVCARCMPKATLRMEPRPDGYAVFANLEPASSVRLASLSETRAVAGAALRPATKEEL